MFKFNKVGLITSGWYKGSQVEIQPDAPDHSGGFHLLVTNKNFYSPNMKGYDSYVESMSDLEAFFNEVHWKVEWDENKFSTLDLSIKFKGEFVMGTGNHKYLGISENTDQAGQLVGLNLYLSNSLRFEKYDHGWADSYAELIGSMREEPKWIIRWL